jgi:GR25 family glycosyltransferase involved in LPS biosynthesis
MKLLNYINQNIEYIIFFGLVVILAVLILNKSLESFFNEQLGINRLDAIIYINLENRADRKDFLMKDLEKLNTNMSKVHKVSGVFIPKNGHKGCIQSHILALNMIKLNKWKRVLILEDDAELDMHPEIVNDLLNKTMDTLDEKHSNWDVIMLGTANKELDDKFNSISINVTTQDGATQNDLKIQKLKTATTSSAYIVKDTYVDNILELFNTCNDNMQHKKLSRDGYEIWALDQKWAELQIKDNWFVLDKDPIKQRAVWSTIMKESHS